MTSYNNLHQCINTRNEIDYIYIYIYTSASPCISMHARSSEIPEIPGISQALSEIIEYIYIYIFIAFGMIRGFWKRS